MLFVPPARWVPSSFAMSVRRCFLRECLPASRAALLPWASARGRARLRKSRGVAHAEFFGSRAAY